ncbi:CDKN2A-interacting protein [Callorhinchus milii]|uniref:CDKN2A-interacting protein n=1 Tax=Callorhinchus milii TaxID=7868 RepID=UPI001C3FE1D2|nr:CDKN2A-interacting protein [Callorhinchus milii]
MAAPVEEDDETVCEFLQQNQGLAAWAEGLRSHHETEKQWRLRRQFILRNMEDFNISRSQPGPAAASTGLDRLLSLSMVWVNHVFMGCRYTKEVMDKVLEMGEDIKIKDAPSHTLRSELVGNKVKKTEVSTSKDIPVATTKDEQVANKVKKRELSDSKEGIGEQPCPKKQLVKEDAPGGFALTSEGAGNSDHDVCLNRIPGLDGFSPSGSSEALSKPQEDDQIASAPTNNSNQTDASRESEGKLIVTQESDPVCHQQAVPSQPGASAQTMPGPSGEVKSKVQPNIQNGSRSVESSQKAVLTPAPQKLVPISIPQKSVQTLPISQKMVPTIISQKPVQIPAPQKPVQTPAPQKPVLTSIPQKSVQTPISQKPVPIVIPQKPVPTIIPQKPVPIIIPQKPVPTIIPQKSVPTIPQKPVQTPLLQKLVQTSIPKKAVQASVPLRDLQALIPQRSAQASIPQRAVQTPTSQSCKTSLTTVNLTPEVMKEKQTFYNKLYKAIAWKLVSAGGFSNDIKHFEMLNNCIEAAKSTLDSVYVPLKDISELHLPQSSAREGIVCELRCKSVYLATGYGKCKVSATEMAAKEAIKLFLKHKVTVKICKRRFKGNEIEDLVLLCEDLHRLNLAPALINPLESCAR